MHPYLNLLQEVLTDGEMEPNRTGINAITLPGATVRFDLRKGAPATTTRKLAFKSGMGELVGFLRASRSAKDFRDLGCKFWDLNANANKAWLENPNREGHDHLGDIYGVSWRQWPAYKVIDASKTAVLDSVAALGYKCLGFIEENGTKKLVMYKAIDQLKQCLETIVNDPYDRRILFHGWNPANLDSVSLPSCHLLYALTPHVAKKEISMQVFIRSNDLFLGFPINAISAAALLALIGRLTGYKPRWLTMFISNAHIYENCLEQVKEQLGRTPYDPPTLRISDRIPDFAKTGVFEPEWLDKVEPSDFILDGYQSHPALTAPMAV